MIDRSRGIPWFVCCAGLMLDFKRLSKHPGHWKYSNNPLFWGPSVRYRTLDVPGTYDLPLPTDPPLTDDANPNAAT